MTRVRVWVTRVKVTRVWVRGVRVWVTRVWVTRVWVRGVRLWVSYSSNSLLPCLAIATDNMFLFVLVGKDSDGSVPGRVVPVVEVDAASPRGLIYRTRTRIYLIFRTYMHTPTYPKLSYPTFPYPDTQKYPKP